MQFPLPTSTKEMLIWLDVYHPERLKTVMSYRSEGEKEAAREFLRQSRKERAEDAKK